MTPRFKYHTEIEELLGKGVYLPDMFLPDNKEAYRWAFEDPHPNNHMPVYKTQPKRIIKAEENGKLDTSGLALSCFETLDASRSRFLILKSSFPNFHKLCESIVERIFR